MAGAKPGLAIVYLPVAGLVPYVSNARTHSDDQVAQIAASIKEFGFTNPILIDGDKGIIAGHGRLQAARKLGLDSVPTIELHGLSDAQRRAYILADNKLALNAGWDNELLALELADLADLDFDLSLVGFDDDELAALLAGSVVDEADLPNLADGDRAPFQQMTFTLHDNQAEQVSKALSAAKALGDFVGTPNENGNGNALSRVCEMFLAAHADR